MHTLTSPAPFETIESRSSATVTVPVTGAVGVHPTSRHSTFSGGAGAVSWHAGHHIGEPSHRRAEWRTSVAGVGRCHETTQQPALFGVGSVPVCTSSSFSRAGDGARRSSETAAAGDDMGVFGVLGAPSTSSADRVGDASPSSSLSASTTRPPIAGDRSPLERPLGDWSA